jgi:acetyltransferase-like isoleucine patch superfamily enzyme
MQRLINSCLRRYKTFMGVYPPHIPPQSSIHHSTTFVGLDKLTLGRYVYIGARCFINCKGGVAIKDGSAISSFVNVLSEDHVFHDAEQIPNGQTMRYAAVNIERAAWIGIGAIILPGVTCR